MKKYLLVLAALGGLLSGCVAYEPYETSSYRDSTAYRADRDRDGVADRRDIDRDGDGVRNSQDRRPDNPRRY